MAATGCGQPPVALPPRPVVIRVQPEAARPGNPVWVWGDHLGTEGSVTLGGTKLAPTAWSGGYIAFRIPADAPIGQSTLAILVGERALPPIPFHVLPPPPVIARVEPPKARVGDEIALIGHHFGSAGKVEFFGAAASEIVTWTPERIAFKIPRFEKVGTIQVLMGPSVSNTVTYELVKPHATAVQPSGNLPGRSVVVAGEAFGATPGQVVVGARRTAAKVAKWSETAIEIAVPDLPMGVQQPVIVVNDNGSSPPVPVDIYGPAPEGVVREGTAQSRFAELRIDAAGFPWLVGYEGGAAVVSRWNGLKWEHTTLEGPADSGWYPSLWLDADGAAHLTYYSLADAQLVYAVYSVADRAWSFDKPDPEAKNCGINSCVRRAKDGTVIIAYFDQGAGKLKVARGKKGAWKLEQVDPAPNVGAECAMELDDAGNPRIAYLDVGLRELKLATWDGGGWSVEWVTGDGSSKPHNHVGPPHGVSEPSLAGDAVIYSYRRGDLPLAAGNIADGRYRAEKRGQTWEHGLLTTEVRAAWTAGRSGNNALTLKRSSP